MNTKIAALIFELMQQSNCRQITFHFDPQTKMKSILVIDSLPKGNKLRASGGTRFAHNNPDDALIDALKLAKAMTRKAKVLGVNEGGAKAVVVADISKSTEMLHAVGTFIQTQNGLFQTAIDMGFTLNDAQIISKKTTFIDSLSHLQKGLGSTGENTAQGMIHGFEVICERLLHKKLRNCTISIQGLGAVGGSLARKLKEKGCTVIATDKNAVLCEQFKRIGIKIVKPDEIFKQEVEIFSPCAFGGILTDSTISQLQCKVVAGGANNPLVNEKIDEKQLLCRGIMFIPDFVLNAGGFLQALVERNGGTIADARDKSKIIGTRINEIIDFSQKNNLSLLESSVQLFGEK